MHIWWLLRVVIGWQFHVHFLRGKVIEHQYKYRTSFRSDQLRVQNSTLISQRLDTITTTQPWGTTYCRLDFCDILVEWCPLKSMDQLYWTAYTNTDHSSAWWLLWTVKKKECHRHIAKLHFQLLAVPIHVSDNSLIPLCVTHDHGCITYLRYFSMHTLIVECSYYRALRLIASTWWQSMDNQWWVTNYYHVSCSQMHNEDSIGLRWRNFGGNNCGTSLYESIFWESVQVTHSHQKWMSFAIFKLKNAPGQMTMHDY